jgi:DNA-3-methyladenine glycosylase
VTASRQADFEPVPRAFFDQPVVDLAKALVGSIIVSAIPGEPITAAKIVETEAYRGPEDLAAHSRGGLRTPRTEVMFGPAGHAYVFLLYGASWAFNIIAGPEGSPHAVLLRGGEPVSGAETMAARRNKPSHSRELTNGPGKLSQALGLNKSHYGLSLGSPELYIAAGPRVPVGRSPRINIDYAGDWVSKPWRFFEVGNRYVSVAPRS